LTKGIVEEESLQLVHSAIPVAEDPFQMAFSYNLRPGTSIAELQRLWLGSFLAIKKNGHETRSETDIKTS